jgi:hypothetical protein
MTHRFATVGLVACAVAGCPGRAHALAAPALLAWSASGMAVADGDRWAALPRADGRTLVVDEARRRTTVLAPPGGCAGQALVPRTVGGGRLLWGCSASGGLVLQEVATGAALPVDEWEGAVRGVGGEVDDLHPDAIGRRWVRFGFVGHQALRGTAFVDLRTGAARLGPLDRRRVADVDAPAPTRMPCRAGDVAPAGAALAGDRTATLVHRYNGYGGGVMALPCDGRRRVVLCTGRCRAVTLGGGAATWVRVPRSRPAEVGAWIPGHAPLRWRVALRAGQGIDVAHTRRRVLVTILAGGAEHPRLLSAVLPQGR